MTATTPPGHDPVEQLLATALRDARTDDRWAVAPPVGMAARVRRTAVRQRRQRALLAVTAGVLAVGGATAGLSLLGASGPGPVDVVAGPPPATAPPSSPTAEPSPVPGIDPAFVPTHGRDWLLSGPDFERFASTHTTPSPRPNPVQSPAPLTDYSARLLADVEAALPAGATTERQDALNGDPATAGIHVRLADGTPVEVERAPLQTPVPYGDAFGVPESRTPPPQDVAGSDSAVLAVPDVGYGWGAGIPEGARSVTVVRRDGEMTRWFAPLTVPLETVVAWALAAEDAGSAALD